jgi:hypothetical protein
MSLRAGDSWGSCWRAIGMAAVVSRHPTPPTNERRRTNGHPPPQPWPVPPRSRSAPASLHSRRMPARILKCGLFDHSTPPWRRGQRRPPYRLRFPEIEEKGERPITERERKIAVFQYLAGQSDRGPTGPARRRRQSPGREAQPLARQAIATRRHRCGGRGA